MKKTTAIICAFNEQETITNIINKVRAISLFDEIIVINDGSTDLTELLIKKLNIYSNIRDIHFKTNKGKGYAMARGVEESNTEHIVFIDADISNFNTSHALQLLEPLFRGESDMVLGQPSETIINYKMNPFKYLTGQRAVRKKDILPIIERMKPSNFGVETLLNLHYLANHKVIKHVCLKKIAHPTKFNKTKPHLALIGFIMALHQIIVCIVLNFDLLRKVIKNRRKTPKLQTSNI